MVRLFAMALSTMSRHVNMCETICSMPRPLTGVRDGLTSMCQEISRMTKMLPSRVGAQGSSLPPITFELGKKKRERKKKPSAITLLDVIVILVVPPQKWFYKFLKQLSMQRQHVPHTLLTSCSIPAEKYIKIVINDDTNKCKFEFLKDNKHSRPREITENIKLGQLGQ